MAPNENPDHRLKITEIFSSIQGESSLAGLRFSFVRLTGCPLRCTYCDTTYSYSGGSWMDIDSIIEAVLKHKTKWVCITGGEPLVQKRCLQLVKGLRSAGLEVSIETDGEEDVGPYVEHAKIIMDIKTPSSGETAHLYAENLDKLTSKDEIKFVIGSEDDYQWSKQIINKYNLDKKFCVLFSPVFGKLELKDLASWIIADHLDVRLQTQLHKHIWGLDVKGV